METGNVAIRAHRRHRHCGSATAAGPVTCRSLACISHAPAALPAPAAQAVVIRFAATAAAAARHVTAARPVRKTLRRESVQPGQIEAFELTPLLAKFPSYVEKLYVDIGDRVEADQPLVDCSCRS